MVKITIIMKDGTCCHHFNGPFISNIPETGQYIPSFVISVVEHQLGPSDNPLHHKQILYH